MTNYGIFYRHIYAHFEASRLLVDTQSSLQEFSVLLRDIV